MTNEEKNPIPILLPEMTIIFRTPPENTRDLINIEKLLERVRLEIERLKIDIEIHDE